MHLLTRHLGILNGDERIGCSRWESRASSTLASMSAGAEEEEEEEEEEEKEEEGEKAKPSWLMLNRFFFKS